MRRMAGARNNDGRVVLEAPGQLVRDMLEDRGAPVAPHQEHRCHYTAELGARDGRSVVAPVGEHFAPHLERVSQQIGPRCRRQVVESASPSADPVIVGSNSGDRIAGREGPPVEFTATCRIDTPVEIEYYRNGGILHTVLVEKNGFIRAATTGSKFESRADEFWGDALYRKWIQER